jgi:glycine/D-amino acid oxidase-like deaminating enzyme
MGMTHDVCIIGGGIVGLATALELTRLQAGASLVLLDKEAALEIGAAGSTFFGKADIVHR